MNVTYLLQKLEVKTLHKMSVFHITTQELGVLHADCMLVGGKSIRKRGALIINVQTLATLLGSVPADSTHLMAGIMPENSACLFMNTVCPEQKQSTCASLALWRSLYPVEQ